MIKKKGTLNISVEAIIIIILAITILGLGLGFIKGMFGKVTTTFDEMISNEPEPAAASSSQPITLSRESMVVEPGQEVALKVGFYHTGATKGMVGCGSVPYTGSPPSGTCSYGCTPDHTNKICTEVATSGCSAISKADCPYFGCSWDEETTTCKGTPTPEGYVPAFPIINCGTGTDVIDDDSTQTSLKEVGIRDRTVSTIVFKISDSATEGVKLCSMSVSGIQEKDITIRVK